MDDKRAPAVREEDRRGDANREGSIDSPKETLGDRGETKKPKRQNPRELDLRASCSALDCCAHSEQARALVTNVTNFVAEAGAHFRHADQQAEKETDRSGFGNRATASRPSACADYREGQRLRVSFDEARRVYGGRYWLQDVQTCGGGIAKIGSH